MSEQGERAHPALGPYCRCGAPGACVLSSWPGSPFLPAQEVPWLPSPRSEPGLQLLGYRRNRPRPLAPLEPSRREGLGVPLGQCLEGGPCPQTYSSQDLHPGAGRLCTYANPPGSGTQREEARVLPSAYFPSPSSGGGGVHVRQGSKPPSSAGEGFGASGQCGLGHVTGVCCARRRCCRIRACRRARRPSGPRAQCSAARPAPPTPPMPPSPSWPPQASAERRWAAPRAPAPTSPLPPQSR